MAKAVVVSGGLQHCGRLEIQRRAMPELVIRRLRKKAPEIEAMAIKGPDGLKLLKAVKKLKKSKAPSTKEPQPILKGAATADGKKSVSQEVTFKKRNTIHNIEAENKSPNKGGKKKTLSDQEDPMSPEDVAKHLGKMKGEASKEASDAETASTATSEAEVDSSDSGESDGGSSDGEESEAGESQAEEDDEGDQGEDDSEEEGQDDEEEGEDQEEEDGEGSEEEADEDESSEDEEEEEEEGEDESSDGEHEDEEEKPSPEQKQKGKRSKDKEKAKKASNFKKNKKEANDKKANKKEGKNAEEGKAKKEAERKAKEAAQKEAERKAKEVAEKEKAAKDAKKQEKDKDASKNGAKDGSKHKKKSQKVKAAGAKAKDDEEEASKKRKSKKIEEASEEKSSGEKKKKHKKPKDDQEAGSTKKVKKDGEEAGSPKKPKKDDEEAGSKKKGKKDDGDGESKLKASEENTKINSNTHHTEYLAYKRWLKNPARFPSVLTAKVGTVEGRKNLFKDWVTCGADVSLIIAKHRQELEETTKSEVKYGFRSEKWLQDTHGEKKARKIMDKKKNLGLTITDPEDEDDFLYFVLVKIDVSNINQLRRITSLECQGEVNQEMLKAFTDQGGVLDPSAIQTTDIQGGKGLSKALEFIKAPAAKAKSKGRSRRNQTGKEDDTKPNGTVEARSVGLKSEDVLLRNFR